MALVRTGVRRAGADGTSPSGYTPADLQSAYGLAAAASKPGGGETIAIVDAFHDPHAISDLASYRLKFGLPACTTATGCLRIRNQYGRTRLPRADPTGGWELEESLDMDMVSAICPSCSILVIEANSASIQDLATAERTAAHSSGVNAVSNSWGSGAEFIGQNQYDASFYAPGVAITAAGGDFGYGAQYPAVSPYVTAVGGTSLFSKIGGGWSQLAWSGTGSGCSALEPKPSWQQVDNHARGGCLNRTANDVSAVADPGTGVAIYDTNSNRQLGGAVPFWITVGGTSVSTPIIAATYALADLVAGGPGKALIPGTLPAQYPYRATTGLTDVIGGSNGRCDSSRLYLCNAVRGFDGPTGLGTPAGTAAFTGSAAGAVTVVNPGTQVVQAGETMRLALQTLPGSATATFATTPSSLPGRLSVTASGVIRGSAPAKAGVYKITVRATVTGQGTGSATFSVVVEPKLTVAHPGTGEVRLDGGALCLTGTGSSAKAGPPVRVERCAGHADQNWAFLPGGAVSGAGTVHIHGQCLAISSGTGSGARAAIQSCTRSGRQQWTYLSGGRLRNAGLGGCLAIHGRPAAGSQAVLWTCGAANTGWVLPPAPVLSGLAGLCLADPASGRATGGPVVAATCAASALQRWTARRNSTLMIGGKCLTVRRGSLYDGAPAELDRCNGHGWQQWQRGPNGQLMNAASGRCLAAPGGSGKPGARLVQQDCYSQPGEIWVIS